MAKAKKRVVKKAKSAKTKTKVLPRKMSALIKIALKDIRKAEASDKYIVDMDTWYEPNEQLYIHTSEKAVRKDGVACAACAAGSVMAFSLGLGHAATRSAVNKMMHGKANTDQLKAIDCLRSGDVLGAAYNLELIDNWDQTPKQDELRETCGNLTSHIPSYDGTDPEPFHTAMQKLQAKLEKAGL